MNPTEQEGAKKYQFFYEGRDLEVPMADNNVEKLEDLRPLLDKLKKAFDGRIDAATLHFNGLQVLFTEGKEATREEIEKELAN